MYFDASYNAKFYFNELESARVRELVRKADAIVLWARTDFHAVIHRRTREAALSRAKGLHLHPALRFADHVEDGRWILIPVHEALLRRTGILMLAAPPHLYIRTADAVHLTTAREIGERDVWTNNRQAWVGITGRSA